MESNSYEILHNLYPRLFALNSKWLPPEYDHSINYQLFVILNHKYVLYFNFGKREQYCLPFRLFVAGVIQMIRNCRLYPCGYASLS